MKVLVRIRIVLAPSASRQPMRVFNLHEVQAPAHLTDR